MDDDVLLNIPELKTVLKTHEKAKIYIKTVSCKLILISGTFESFLAGLGQKSNVWCITSVTKNS